MYERKQSGGGRTMTLDKTAKQAKQWTVSIARAVFLVAFSFILIYPVIFMIANSIKTQADTMNPAVTWISNAPSVYSYQLAFRGMEYIKAFLNTVKFEIVSAVIEVFACAIYAYGLSRFKLRIKPVLMVFLVLIILVPDVVLIIPRILNFRRMDVLGILGLFNKLTGVDLRVNLTDTVWTFYLPSMLGVGLKGGLLMYIYMQFFKGLPAELEEAAWIDGAGPFRTFFSVVLPSSGVVILTVFIFAVVWHWNDWLLALMYTSESHTLATEIYDITDTIQFWARANNITIDLERNYGTNLAACLLFVAPPTVMYLFLQKKFIQSIDRVGIVG